MSHNVVYLFSTSNLGNYQADMTISHLALTQSTLLKYFQKIIIKLHPLSTRADPQLIVHRMHPILRSIIKSSLNGLAFLLLI